MAVGLLWQLEPCGPDSGLACKTPHDLARFSAMSGKTRRAAVLLPGSMYWQEGF